MKITFSSLLLGLLFITSCQEDPKLRALAQEKEVQKKEVIFKNISNGWNFSVQPNNETSRSLTNTWGEWRVLLNELAQKPKSSLGAFQQKAKTLSKRANDINNNVPIEFNIPEIKSRINALCTKINAINLYIHLNQIPAAKIVKLVQEVNTEISSLQFQFEEINRKSQIKIEDGESDMLKMLDTIRAIPNNSNAKIIK
ncbi:MAG: hypothetical protein ACOYLT_02385 [Flavobacterium sp.]|uniref:hypothetical protein n=1 Tax=Flavobacterium sp. TaxID=239 RepID=UPI003BD5DC8F